MEHPRALHLVEVRMTDYCAEVLQTSSPELSGLLRLNYKDQGVRKRMYPFSRFLLNEPAGEEALPAVSVVLNWTSTPGAKAR
jgi:hypothetical protein